MDQPQFDWEAPVAFVQIWPDAGFRDTTERMTMRQAVERFLVLPEAVQRCCSIEPMTPYEEDGITYSFVSFQMIAALARRMRN